jgi:hypothetical protein
MSMTRLKRLNPFAIESDKVQDGVSNRDRDVPKIFVQEDLWKTFSKKLFNLSIARILIRLFGKTCV